MPKAKDPPRFRGIGSVDAQIREAQREGAFDDLPGSGKPLRNLGEAYDPAWWTKKLVEREKISMLPAALELRRSVERALERLPTLRTEDEVRSTVEELNAEIRRRNATVTSGPSTHIAPLDVDTVVERWREHVRAE